MTHKSIRRILSTIAFLLGGLFVATPVIVGAGAVTQGYKAVTTLQKGAIVSLTKSGSQEVEKTNTDNDVLLVGVVVDSADSLVDLLPQGSQVRVAVSGEVTMFVSTINGDIASGERLISTPLSGIAGRDYPPAPGAKYIAVANTAFSDKTAGAKKISISQSDGSKKDVYVGTITVKLLLGSRTVGAKDQNVLTSVGKSITGKTVSLLQVLAATAVFITTIGLAGMVLQGSIRGTFVSLGRNPLSRDSIMTSLVKVIALSVVIIGAGAGAGAAYLILLF